MIDDNDQEMEVEDILASIKSILEEDQAVSQDEVKAPEAAIVETEIDDILELSPDMRLASDTTSESEDINLANELNDIEAPQLADENISADDLSVEIAEETPLGISLGSEDYKTDPFYEEENDNKKESDIVESGIADFENLEDVAVSTIDNETIVRNENTVLLDDVAEDEVTNNIKPDIEAVSIKDTNEDITDFVVEPIDETNKETIENSDNSVDASADIISNFAKMFAQEAPKPEIVASPVAEPIKILGDGSKTIEDVVASVIKQIIGEEVAAKWKDGLDYDALARQEIQRQTKEWLDNNLSATVEKIVKQEIERVMAKVGTGQ